MLFPVLITAVVTMQNFTGKLMQEETMHGRETKSAPSEIKEYCRACYTKERR